VLALLVEDVGDQHASAFVDQKLRGGAADTPTATGDDRDPAGQPPAPAHDPPVVLPTVHIVLIFIATPRSFHQAT
jgi:hypothetical protein